MTIKEEVLRAEVKKLSKFETKRVIKLKEEHKKQVEGFVEDLQAFLDKKLEQKDMNPFSLKKDGWIMAMEKMKEFIEEKKKKWFGGKNEE